MTSYNIFCDNAIFSLRNALNEAVNSNDFSSAHAILGLIKNVYDFNAANVVSGAAAFQVLPEEGALMQTDGIIPAIKVLRARTGCGLKEAKDACEAYAASQGWVRIPNSTRWGTPFTPTLTPGEIELLSTVGKIRVIKDVQTRTGLGLREAKNLVEKFISDNNLLLDPNSDNGDYRYVRPVRSQWTHVNIVDTSSDDS